MPQSAANGSQATVARRHAVLVAHAGHDEAEAGRLHHVDDEGDRQHDHQPPVRAAQAARPRRGDRDACGTAGDRSASLLRQQAVAGDAEAGDDQRHAPRASRRPSACRRGESRCPGPSRTSAGAGARRSSRRRSRRRRPRGGGGRPVRRGQRRSGDFLRDGGRAESKGLPRVPGCRWMPTAPWATIGLNPPARQRHHREFLRE